ncbi:MAG TPA: hypothetical protein VG759_03175, partial [Candidatus Angelobacter sp.]|nr:hypothetical protein [Candidatus Angelobacter sp.]
MAERLLLLVSIFQAQEFVATFLRVGSKMAMRHETLFPTWNAVISGDFIIHAYAGLPFLAVLAFEWTQISGSKAGRFGSCAGH